MASDRILSFSREERAVYTLISTRDGLKAKEIASSLNLTRADVNHLLFSSPLMRGDGFCPGTAPIIWRASCFRLGICEMASPWWCGPWRTGALPPKKSMIG